MILMMIYFRMVSNKIIVYYYNQINKGELNSNVNLECIFNGFQ